MDNPWWSSGAFTIAGGLLTWLGTSLNAKREHHARLQATRRDVYSRFIGACHLAVATRDRNFLAKVLDLVAEIQLISTLTTLPYTDKIVRKIEEVAGKEERDFYASQEAARLLSEFTLESRIELGMAKRRWARHPKEPDPRDTTST
jgi:hypothetical protein